MVDGRWPLGGVQGKGRLPVSRFRYWTILLGTDPTAFRAARAEDLVPTLTQLQRRHPEAVIRWFERGRLWQSPTDARDALEASRRSRDRDWRPGGAHRDPRARYERTRDEKRAAFKHRQRGPSIGPARGPSGDQRSGGSGPGSAPAAGGQAGPGNARPREPAPGSGSRGPGDRGDRGRGPGGGGSSGRGPGGRGPGSGGPRGRGGRG